MHNKVEQASGYFAGGLYCSQAVLGAFCEDYGLERQKAFDIACGLGSGVRCADICGAVSGAVLVIGLKYGGDQQKCNQKTEEFLKLYRQVNGDIICRELLGCDISTPQGVKEAQSKDLYATRCMDLVISAAELLEQLGY